MDIVNEATTEFDTASGDKLPDDHPLNACFESEDGKSLLLVAISQGKTFIEYVNVLLNAGVPPNLINEELKTYPLHFASKERNIDAMTHLIRCGANVNMVLGNGRTALHICAEIGFKEGALLLLEQNRIEIDLPDKKLKQTPLYLAVAKSGNLPIVTALLEHGADVERVCVKKTIREHIYEKLEGFNPDSVKKKFAKLIKSTSNSVLEQISDVLDEAALATTEGNRNELLQKFESIIVGLDKTDVDGFEALGTTLLQKIVDLDLVDFAKVILDQQLADVNQVSEGRKTPPILYAVKKGNVEMLQLLLQHNADLANAIIVETKETVLHIILKKDSTDKGQIEKWNDCFLFLMGKGPEIENAELARRIRAEVCEIVNKRDCLSNTSLHYATQKWSSVTIRALLEHGANIGMKNKWDEVPIKSINPETMENFLDEHCLRSNYNTRKEGAVIDMSHKALEFTFNYSFLAPSNEDLPLAIQQKSSTEPSSFNNVVDDEESQQKLAPNDANEPKDEVKYVLPETESLWHMAQSQEHRYLLNHPVITSFLWLKWGRIRRYYNRNLRFYLMFVFVMTWYIFYGLGGARKANGLGVNSYWPEKAINRTAQTDDEKNFNDIIYGFYIFFAACMTLFILRDWRSDILDVLKADKLRHTIKMIKSKNSNSDNDPERRSCLKNVLMVIASNWMEVSLIVAMIVLIIVREDVLWIMMLILLVGLVFREFVQLMASLRRYILSPENWIEVSMIILVSILLFYKDDKEGIELKRHLAAFAIVFSWTELITLIGKHPKLSRYKKPIQKLLYETS